MANVRPARPAAPHTTAHGRGTTFLHSLQASKAQPIIVHGAQHKPRAASRSSAHNLAAPLSSQPQLRSAPLSAQLSRHELDLAAHLSSTVARRRPRAFVASPIPNLTRPRAIVRRRRRLGRGRGNSYPMPNPDPNHNLNPYPGPDPNQEGDGPMFEDDEDEYPGRSGTTP